MWLSRATFISEAEVEHVLDELQAADALPDVVHVDGWLAGNVFQTFTCEWRGDHARFPNGWTDRLRRRGVCSSVWPNPFVLAGSETGKVLRERGLLPRHLDGTPAATAGRDNRMDRGRYESAGPRLVARARGRPAGRGGPGCAEAGLRRGDPAGCYDCRRGAAIRNAFARM